MTLPQDGSEDGTSPTVRRQCDALLTFLLVLLGGAALTGAAEHFAHLGADLGNALFALLPLVAVSVAAARLDHSN